MAEDPAHPWGSGATRYRWRSDVRAIVSEVLHRWPRVTANTYVCHPWCGWADVSVDFWGPGGRGDPLLGETPAQIRRFLMAKRGRPNIRHTILDHQLWTSWGGYSRWTRDDHAGRQRHLHVTYWQ